MMLHFYLRLILIPVLLFTAVLLLIHTQPYDDHELRKLLLPEGCPAPCFMGIYPGVTTVDEAVKLLRASGWVDQIHYEQDSSAMRVQWNEKKPAWLGNSEPYGYLYLWIEKGVVSQLSIETNLMLGAIHLGMGQPPFQHISRITANHNYLFYAVVYPNEHINMSITRDCSLQKGSVNYLDKVFLNYSQSNTEASVSPNYHATWLNVLHTPCR